ncbi:MAG: bifunctional phosphoglucose/phosphomannose isomerase [archaeon]
MTEDEEIMKEEELVFPEDYYPYDSEDLKSVIQGFASQINLAYRQNVNVEFDGNINAVIVAGMGGSAIAGDLLETCLKDDPTPIGVCRGYNLPKDADKETLVIVSSYSGNTEETLSAYKDALRKSCKIVAITTGGKLAQLCQASRTQIIKIPTGMQPRAALAYSFFPMLKLMEHLRITNNKEKEVETLIKNLDKKVFLETGISLSEKMFGKIPLIYSSEIMEAVAYRWKTQINENAKAMAFSNVFSELNHNEMQGIENLNAEFCCVMLRTDKDQHRVSKRMDITKEHLRKKGIDVTDIAIKGNTLLTKLFTAIYMGDWTSYFLALRYKTNPTPVPIIEKFKKELGTYIA